MIDFQTKHDLIEWLRGTASGLSQIGRIRAATLLHEVANELDGISRADLQSRCGELLERARAAEAKIANWRPIKDGLPPIGEVLLWLDGDIYLGLYGYDINNQHCFWSDDGQVMMLKDFIDGMWHEIPPIPPKGNK